MGFLLKEVLRCLCCEFGWSYAVFWKIALQNPSLLVWEEGHYELVRHSELNVGRTQLFPNKCNGLWNPPKDRDSQFKHQEEERIDILVNRMMMPQVHVLGEGIVGRAAFMGNHRWILQESCFDHEPMYESQSEVQHQFLAGIQTIAVIPVLPHGVVQLGSIQLMIENIGFVNHVKSLFMQLGSVPKALLSDNTNNALSKKMQVPVSHGVPISAEQSRNACSSVARFTPLIGDSHNQKFLQSPALRCVSQPSCSSVTQMDNSMQTNALLVPLTSNSTGTTSYKSHGAFFHPNAVSVAKPSPQGGKLENETMGSQIIIPNSDVQLNQHLPPFASSSGSSNPASVVRSGLPCHRLMLMEQQILSSEASQEATNNYVPTSPNNTKTFQLGSHESKASRSFKESVIFPLLGRNESPRTRNETSISNQCGAWRLVDTNPSCPPLEGIALQTEMGVVSMSKHPNHSNSTPTHLISGESLPSHQFNGFKHTGTEGAMGQQRIQKDLFESLESPSADPEEPISLFGCMPTGSFEGCWVSSSKRNEGSQNSIREENGVLTTICGESFKGFNKSQPHSKLNENSSNATMRPSPARCDLFDALGLDFKIRQHHHGWDDMLLHGVHENAGNLREDISTCLPQFDVPLHFDPMNEVISESGVFSDSGTDNLLDAVVSKIHSSAKQILDDNVSCKTTLTKASSSVHNNSTYSGKAILEHIPGDLSGQFQALAKPDMAESSSFKTSCSLNKTGECCQTESLYKSRIGSRVEDELNTKCGSISTAFSKRIDEAGKPNRKRPRPGENPRPRPKDRQMIQDRVKELREIVPNGAKCSIDALLERTIKHMVFLQSVTKHADKLKQTGESKIINKDGCLFLKNNSDAGKTLAFEVSSQSMVCPIIVEDLNEPRQMLVEILCEERGFFLEIADVIRGLGLTILKGVMEARDEKVWARFVVEANRDVTRMNVFLSLVRLLEQTMKGSSSTAKCFDGSSVGHNIYHQSSFPMTSLTDAFQ